MRTTTEFHRDDPAVGVRDLVGTDAETGPQRTGQRDEESAGAAVCRGLLGHRGVWALLAGVPALGGLDPAHLRQHPDSAETEFEGDLLDLRIVGQQVAGHQPGIVRRGWQQVAGAEVTRLQPLAPRHPLRRQQGTLAGQQDHLGDGRWAVRRAHHGDRPVPAEVAGPRGGKGVGGGQFVLRADAEVDADLAAGHLDRRGTGLIHRRGQDGVDGLRFGGCAHACHCGTRGARRWPSLVTIATMRIFRRSLDAVSAIQYGRGL